MRTRCNKIIYKLCLSGIVILTLNAVLRANNRITENFNKNWQFTLGDTTLDMPAENAQWRDVSLPHDWSIEGSFSKDHPATPGGGALPGGVGWYRKKFKVPKSWYNRKIWIEFDGIYRNGEIWINNKYVGKRPYGYISFRFEISRFLNYVEKENTIIVRVDNSRQPNSRWYSGSGIYRNVRLVVAEKLHIEPWGIFITTPYINKESATVRQQTVISNETDNTHKIKLTIDVLDMDNKVIVTKTISHTIKRKSIDTLTQDIVVSKPKLWSLEQPNLYATRTRIMNRKKIIDKVNTIFGIRYFSFDPEKGFFLNGKHVKINGVCNHHDLGCLGAAVYPRALERQLELLKNMGCNAIRTSHNPPAPELLDLCDKMGFIVMVEAFDMWKKGKTKYDYSLDWDEWHEKDIADMVLRDRNHPSVFIWSIGNEVIEQWDHNDSSGIVIARELARIVKKFDPTRPITAACNDATPDNPVIKSGILDIIGYNYSHEKYPSIPEVYPGKPFIATETVSALATRGHYDMPSDSIRRWPPRWDLPLLTGNPDNTCSSYDNCSTPWGSTHEETWRVVKKYDHVSGMFIWTGFDYLGEPTPYDWPSRSSYFGILDLAGFPKDIYYFYQSEWTKKPVLHIFPHWNWQKGDTVDIWTYTNCDEVELFLNGNTCGTKRKEGENLHLQWRIPYTPGSVSAVGKINGKNILTKTISTAGEAEKLQIESDRTKLLANGTDLAFITIRITDRNGTIVPNADNKIKVTIQGPGDIIGMDNGCQTSLEPFKTNERKAFNGLCLAVIKTKEEEGKITVMVESAGLKSAEIKLKSLKTSK